MENQNDSEDTVHKAAEASMNSSQSIPWNKFCTTHKWRDHGHVGRHLWIGNARIPPWASGPLYEYHNIFNWRSHSLKQPYCYSTFSQSTQPLIPDSKLIWFLAWTHRCNHDTQNQLNHCNWMIADRNICTLQEELIFVAGQITGSLASSTRELTLRDRNTCTL